MKMVNKITRSRVAAVAVGAVILVGGAGAGAYAHGKITAQDIVKDAVGSSELRPDAVKGNHVNEGSLRQRHLADGLKGKVNAHGIVAPEVDGFYETLPEGDGTEVQTFTANCADGKVATGGGFSIDFPQHRANVQFVGSTPANFEEISDDPQGSVVARGWEIQVINNGPETSVRPWVACAMPAE